MAKVSAVILIYDIRGFTAVSKKIATAELGAFATAAHQTILGLFAPRPPSFVKNLGDGHLLIWETTDDPEKELVSFVVEAAKKARAAFPAFVAGQKAEGVELPKHVGIGVAVGDVSRSDDYYGVAVNLAARLQNLARPEGLAMDDTVFGMVGKREELMKQGFRKTKVNLKGLGSTLVWVDRPFSWERLLLAAGWYVAIAMVPIGYILLADSRPEPDLPGSAYVQKIFDRYEFSIFRRVQPEAEVRRVADRDRRAVAEVILAARLPDGRIATNVRDLNDPSSAPPSVWGSSQAIAGLLSAPHLDVATKRMLITSYGDYLFDPKNFVPGYGWPVSPGSKYTLGEPGMWTICALARALAIPGVLEGEQRKTAEERLQKAQAAVMIYRPIEATGGWNIFPNQKVLERHSVYTSALALLALMETHSARMPWDGSEAKRDELLKKTVSFLVSRYVHADGKVGWRRSPSMASPISEGLTLQLYAELIRAEQECGVTLPPEMLAEIPKHLARMAFKRENDPYDAGEFVAEFKNHEGEEMPGGNESINFLWHSWAIDAAVRWLKRPQSASAPKEDIVRVRRSLGYLVVTLSDPMRQKAVDGESFIGGETLLGYSGVIPP